MVGPPFDQADDCFDQAFGKMGWRERPAVDLIAEPLPCGLAISFLF